MTTVVSMFPGCQSYGAVAVFNPAAFKVMYPQWAALPNDQLCMYFDIATLYWRNDGSSPARNAQIQGTLLNLLTAHITALMAGPDGKGASAIVGRVNSASEGSVSIGADYPATASNAWFLQTSFGALFWQATAAYRTARYIPGPTRFGNGLTPRGRGCVR